MHTIYKDFDISSSTLYRNEQMNTVFNVQHHYPLRHVPFSRFIAWFAALRPTRSVVSEHHRVKPLLRSVQRPPRLLQTHLTHVLPSGKKQPAQRKNAGMIKPDAACRSILDNIYDKLRCRVQVDYRSTPFPCFLCRRLHCCPRGVH